MSDIKIAVKRIQMPDALSGTVDCTETDFGTVKAILVFMSYAEEGESYAARASSVGAWDGTNARCAYSTSRNGLTTTDANRGYSETYVAVVMNLTSVIAAYSASAITNGVRFTMSIDGTSVARYATVIMFGGADCQAAVGTATTSTTNEKVSVTGAGFRPQIVFCGGSGLTGVASTSTQDIMSFGVAAYRNGMQNRGIFWTESDAQLTSRVSNYLSNQYCTGQFYSDALTWGGNITAMTNDGFEFETTGTTGEDVFWYLALNLDTYNAMIQDISARAGDTGGSGIDSITGLGFKPSHLLACMCIANSYNTLYQYLVVNIGASDGTTEHCTVFLGQDGVTTSNNWSYNAQKLISLRYAATSNSGELTTANVDNFNNDGFDLNYTAVHSTSNYLGWTVAFQTEESPRAMGAIGHKFLLLELA
jgi:hypothetical protein